MIEKLEAVVTDLDGSLLGPDRRIGQEDVETVAKLKNRGIPVFVATGRHQSLCRVYAQELGTELPCITSNGALLYDFAREEILEMDVISSEDVAALREFTDSLGLLYYIYTDRQCFLMSPADPESESFKSELTLRDIARPGEVCIMEPDFDPLACTVVKYMVPDCGEAQYRQLLGTSVAKRVEPAFSGWDFLDVTPLNATKGTAVEKLSRRYGFSLEHTLILGDNFNDTSMLTLAGYPVVPASADPRVRELARLVTTPSGQNPLTHAVRSLFPGLLG